MKYSPKKIKEQLNQNSFYFKKKLGQNFIIEENIINAIIDKANIDKDTLVIEIGPGAGSLTNKLCEKAGNVLCYEIDNSLENILHENLKEYKNYKIIYKDFLLSNPNDLLEKYKETKLYIIANLPYYITTPIIMHVIDLQLPIDKMVLMVQKEVGNRFQATPHMKEYNSLTIFLNYYFEIKKILDVSRNVFLPRPNVDSIVVQFTRKKCQMNVKDKKLFFKLIKDSFKQKRKTIKNNLRQYNLENIEMILKKYGYDLSVRAEDLSIDIFVEIANSLL